MGEGGVSEKKSPKENSLSAEKKMVKASAFRLAQLTMHYGIKSF